MNAVQQPQAPRRRGQRAWTDAQRAEQAEKCRARQVWAHSTGPRTVQGKAISCLNALKHGQFSRPVRDFMKHFRNYRAFLRFLHAQRKQLVHFQQNELGNRKHAYAPRLTPRLPKRRKPKAAKLNLPPIQWHFVPLPPQNPSG